MLDLERQFIEHLDRAFEDLLVLGLVLFRDFDPRKLPFQTLLLQPLLVLSLAGTTLAKFLCQILGLLVLVLPSELNLISDIGKKPRRRISAGKSLHTEEYLKIIEHIFQLLLLIIANVVDGPLPGLIEGLLRDASVGPELEVQSD